MQRARKQYKIPYITANIPGIGGRIKVYPQDFRVEEIPLYEASGQGDHTYIRIEKTAITTQEATARIARHLGLRPRDIGYAGIKDSNAVTIQTLSAEHIDPAALDNFTDNRIAILGTSRHSNKLRPGHLKMNRFRIRIRDAQPDLQNAQKILDVLISRGVPDFFGPQRFGNRGDTALLGRALVQNDYPEFLSILLGRPCDRDSSDCQRARLAFDANDLDAAISLWPAPFREERKILKQFIKTGDPARTVGIVDRRMKRLYVSAFQSDVFNTILSRRLDSIDKLLPGDIAKKCDNGGVFRVEDLAVEQARVDRFEISPTAPLPGYKCLIAEAEAGDIETAVFDEMKIVPSEIKKVDKLKIKGTRRALRFKLDDPHLSSGNDEHGDYVELEFGAPSGSYATIVTGEIMKGAYS